MGRYLAPRNEAGKRSGKPRVAPRELQLRIASTVWLTSKGFFVEMQVFRVTSFSLDVEERINRNKVIHQEQGKARRGTAKRTRCH